jgi:hypothetical protein
MVPASSRSEFVVVPVGLAVLTRSCWMTLGKGDRHRKGVMVPSRAGMNKTPPMPDAAASEAPMAPGAVSIISRRRVGRACRSRTSQRRSSRKSCICGESRTRRLVSWRSVSWNRLNRPRRPGRARTMLRSSPTICCQRRVAIRVFDRGSSSKMEMRRSRRRGGSWRVLSTELITHPRRVLVVCQEPSPLRSFFTEIGSCRESGSLGSSGRKMASIDSNKMRRTRCWRRAPPWTRPK